MLTLKQKRKSTVTTLKEIQSQIATTIDQGYYVAMGSLDLSAAFNMVNVDLLIMKLKFFGLPASGTNTHMLMCVFDREYDKSKAKVLECSLNTNS
jgi:nicotinic acid phosphoribosyltransferase